MAAAKAFFAIVNLLLVAVLVVLLLLPQGSGHSEQTSVITTPEISPKPAPAQPEPVTEVTPAPTAQANQANQAPAARAEPSATATTNSSFRLSDESHFSAWLEQARRRCCSPSFSLSEIQRDGYLNWLDSLEQDGFEQLLEQANNGSPRALALANTVLSGRDENARLFGYRLQLMSLLSHAERKLFAEDMVIQAQGFGSDYDALLWLALSHYWQPQWQLDHTSLVALIEQLDLSEQQIDTYGLITELLGLVQQVDDYKLTLYSDIPQLTLEQVGYYYR